MKYKDADKSNLDQSIIKKLEESNKDKKGLFFFGNTGTGKTYTLHALAKNKGKVDNFVELLANFRDAMRKGFYLDNLNDYCNKEFIFIDDVGAENISEFVLEFFYLVVNKRYENMKRTVISTNLTIEAFKDRYGDRILSRLSEMCLIIELKGDDRRL